MNLSSEEGEHLTKLHLKSFGRFRCPPFVSKKQLNTSIDMRFVVAIDFI